MTLPSRDILRLASIGSTNVEAWRLLTEEGRPAGFVVVAEGQTDGRGRDGRAFHSPPGGGLWATVTHETGASHALLPAFGVAAAVAAAESLASKSGLTVSIRWPNDLMIGERKTGGILAESRRGFCSGSWVVLGLGVNLGLERLPADLEGIATSVRLAGGRVPGPAALLTELLSRLDPLLADLDRGRTTSLEARWRALCRTGGPVEADTSDGPVRGTLSAVSLDGIVIDEGGSFRRLEAGRVRRLTELARAPGG